ncbi:MAG: polysaccharide biosynthesis protein, partial [Proteobacteria bacterium]|nr:polysaccharide biosynthesis protein [Pseudomonadota bacterium]
LGTLACAKAAVRAGVKYFILVSTDKAVRPTNVMGASKRLAEMALQALADDRSNSSTCFAMVRFGNVLGSSGSVIPLFNRQIEAGGPVTLTHEDMTRYFMTIPEAAQLVIQAGAMARGGEVFVLDMGQPVRISDLARSLIQAKGLLVRDAVTPWGDIEIKVTGIRSGEKLYEELLIGEGAQATEHSRIMRAHEPHPGPSEMEALLARLATLIELNDVPGIKQLLQQHVSGYQPENSGSLIKLDWSRLKAVRFHN